MMPEDEFVEELDTDSPKKDGGSKLLIIILLMNTILIMVAIAYFIFFYNKNPQPVNGKAKIASKSKEKKEKKKKLDIATGPIVEMNAFVVNLDEASSSRYLKITIAVELDKKETEAEFNNKKIVARDQILMFLSTLNTETTSGIQGKEMIKEGIIKRLNNVMVSGKIKNVYFKDFVVQ
jgi:flagellar FliL protein